MAEVFWREGLFICVNLFLAHLTKGHVSFCHHLASIVIHPSLSVSYRNMAEVFWRECSFICVNLFLAHLTKGHVSFCHHLASIVIHPSICQT
jgi:hypothetical protein